MGTAAIGAVGRPAGRHVLPRWLSFDHPLPWLLPLLAMVLALGVYPLLYSVWLSLHAQNFYTRKMEFVGLAQWARMFADARMWSALETTFVYSTLCLLIELVLGMAIALLLDEDRPGYGLMRALMTLPLVVPPAIAGLMFLLLEDGQYGVLSYVLGEVGLMPTGVPILGQTHLALWGVILTDVWQWTPFMVLIFLAGLRALPKEPYEAASLDGASAVQAFRFITLPMLGKVIAIAILIRGIDVFRIYDYVYVMTSGGPGTETETLSFYAGRLFGLANFPLAATLSLFTLIVLNLVAMLFVKIARVRF